MSEDEVRRVVAEFTEGRTFGFLGEQRVNVLLMNLALDERLNQYRERQRPDG
jgi:K+-transporting ATPase ATPase C chain